MRHLKHIFTAAMAAALAFASCTKEIEAPDETGQEEESYSRETGASVVFGVSTGDDNKAKTKAEEYSEEIFANVDGELQKIGEVSTGYESEPETKVKYSDYVYEGKERINWELNDVIEIHCPEAWTPANSSIDTKRAQYKIDFIWNKPNISEAKIVPAGEHNLKWGNNRIHNFYAAYPKIWDGTPNKFNKVLSGDIAQGSYNGKYRFTAEVPEIQANGNKPIITATTRADKQEGGAINLDFKPAVNTFEIIIKNERPTTIYLKKVWLVSKLEKLSGTYNINLYPEQEKQEYTFQGLTQKDRVGYILDTYVASNSGHIIRLYTLPVDIKYLSLVLELDNESINLEFKNKNGEWITFNKEKKYKLTDIRIPPSVEKFDYTFSVDTDTVFFRPFYLRYPHLGTKSINSIFVKSFRINADGSKNEAVPWGYSDANWLNNSSDYNPGLPGNAPNNGQTKYSMALEDYDPEDDELHELYKMDLSERYELTDYDLSTKGGTTQRNTANCYVVKQRGTYKFPVVYGNGIKNGNLNIRAFRARPTDESDASFLNVLQEFVDGAGTEIATTQVYFNAAEAILVWEDARGLIEKLYLKKGSDNRQYVHFEIGDNIDYGNALIAVNNSQGTVLWTWHIWVTDADFNQEPGQFLSVPLGYRPELEEVPQKVRPLELKQVDIKGKSKTIYTKVLHGYTYPSCLYYTPGAMRPLIPTLRFYSKEKSGVHSKHSTSLAKCYTAEFTNDGSRYNTSEFRLEHVSERLSIAQAISTPHKVFSLEKNYWNLWNNNNTNNMYLQYNESTLKTVYDPSPVGYKMPTKITLQNIPNSITERFKMGGYKDDIFSISGLGLFIQVYNFAEIGEFFSAWGSLQYPEGAQGDNTSTAIIIPIKD